MTISGQFCLAGHFMELYCIHSYMLKWHTENKKISWRQVILVILYDVQKGWVFQLIQFIHQYKNSIISTKGLNGWSIKSTTPLSEWENFYQNKRDETMSMDRTPLVIKWKADIFHQSNLEIWQSIGKKIMTKRGVLIINCWNQKEFHPSIIHNRWEKESIWQHQML